MAESQRQYEGGELDRAPSPIVTYSLEQVAAMVLPPEWKDAERWLKRRLQRGDIPGYKVGRGAWRMTHQDVENFIAACRNKPAAPTFETGTGPATDVVLAGLSPRSRARIVTPVAGEQQPTPSGGPNWGYAPRWIFSRGTSPWPCHSQALGGGGG